MKTLYIECNMGVAGDMLTAALVDLFPDKEAVVKELNDLNIPGITYRLTETEKCGIRGLHMDVLADGETESEEMYDHHHHDEEEHCHHHDEDEHCHHDGEEHHHHDHGDHEHHHSHSSMHDIEHTVKDLGLSPEVEKDVLAVYALLADAESRVHGVPVSEIHFHEVGTKDAVADITAVCYLLNKLSVDRIVSSNVNTGSGKVRCAHGILPVPAPATALLLSGVPMYNDGVKGELTTPTGAALIRHFAGDFGDMPAMNVTAIGYGMGTKDFERANCVRLFLGDSAEKEQDSVLEISCNVDDMTAEEIGFATERLFEGGALEVYTVAIGMKKNRPGTLIKVMCVPEKREEMVELLFKHTSTLGVRELRTGRYILNRRIDTVDTEFGPVRVKRAEGYGVARHKAEFDDLAKIAKEHDIGIREAGRLVEKKLRD